MTHKNTPQSTEIPVPLPPIAEIFDKHQIVERHPHLMSEQRVMWALRHRKTNGLEGVVFESRSGELLIHEPGFLRWFLGLEGRSKPRRLRK